MRLLILGTWHAGSNAAQYAAAFRALGHEVVTCGPRFALEDAFRWYQTMYRHECAEPSETWGYVHDVLAQSPAPDVETVTHAWVSPGKLGTFDAILKFDAYGETPLLNGGRRDGVCAVVYGDTHTGHLARQVEDARGYDHVFVQFRRSDLAAFDHPSKHWLPAAADPAIWRPMPEMETWYDAVFVGSTDPEVHRDRVELISHLRQDGIAVHVAHAYGEKAARLYSQARVVLNRSLAGDLNMRVVEAMACGACLVTDNVDGLDSLFSPGIDYLGYGTPAKAARLVRALLEEGAERSMGHIAADAVRAAHTYEHRARQILDVLFPAKEERQTDGGAALGLEPGHAGRGDPGDRGVVVRAGGGAAAAPALLPAAPAPVPAPPSVTVVIPAYNHWDDCTRPLVTRLLGEHEHDAWLQVLVVDDGSTDDTKYADVIHHETNKGFAAACNTGAKEAKGRVLVFLNNDAQPEPGWLDPLVADAEDGGGIAGALILHPDGSLQSAGVVQDGAGEWGNDVAWAWGRELAGEKARDVPAVMGACLAVRRDVFWRLGGFDQGFPSGCEDVDLCLRAAEMGLPVRLVPASRVRHAEGTTRGTLPDTQAKIAASQQRLRERWHDRHHDGERRGAGGDRGGDGGPSDRGRAVDTGAPVGAAPVTPTPGTRVCAQTRGDTCLVWDGPTSVEDAGSIAVINQHLQARLPGLLHGTRLGRVRISHRWTGYGAGWDFPTADIDHWFVIAPWEGELPVPPAWNRSWDHPKFRMLFTPSEHSKRFFVNDTKLSADKITVVPNGVDLDVFTPSGPVLRTGSDATRFLFVGGLISRKGIDALYDAWRDAFQPDDAVRLVLKVQGADSFYAHLTRRPPAFLPNVQVIDSHLTPQQMAKLYRACDVLIHPSTHEAFGMPVLEAMACGLPVVVPAGGPWDEYVPAGAGLVVPAPAPGPGALAACLRWCVRDKAELAAIGAAGAAAARDYGWATIAARYARHIEEACGRDT